MEPKSKTSVSFVLPVKFQLCRAYDHQMLSYAKTGTGLLIQMQPYLQVESISEAQLPGMSLPFVDDSSPMDSTCI